MDRQYSEAELRRLKAGQKLASPPEGEDVVISGLAGRFPNSNDAGEFLENLMNKVDLCDDDDRRWPQFNAEIPQKAGKINNVEEFDAGQFGVHPAHANGMDPMQRMILEKGLEAIMDAGLHPDELAGTNTGVFIGTCYSESETRNMFYNLQENSCSAFGCSRSLQAQRISYALKLNGPSLTCDTACSSSLYAFDLAYRSIREGKCDQALVGGSNLCFQPNVTLQFARLGVLNLNTGCRPFDDGVDGYTRSEAITMVFLQKSKDAKRIYAKVLHSKVNVDGYKEEGITYPSGLSQRVLFEDIYSECDVDSKTIAFVEAHGTGTVVGDPEELAAIDNFFCTGRKEPLLIGSVKGNIGHTEPASGLCSIIKMIYGMETGLIPPNINYSKPRRTIQGLLSKRLQVVTEPTPWPAISSVGGINCFGFGGANCHVVMKRNEKTKIIAYDNLPRLICFSGRTPKSIQSFHENLKHVQLDYDYVGLLHEVFKYNIANHNYRGYSVISKDGEVSRSSKYYGNQDQNLYLCIGNSTHYSYKTIEELKQINAFKASIGRFNSILKENNMDIDLSLKSEQNNMLHQVLVSLAIQIGIIDILRALEITPDFIVSSSMGDFTSAYANDALTMEEIILSTYTISQLVLKSRGNETNLEREILKSLKNIIVNKPTKTVKPITLKSNIFPYGSAEYFMYNIFNPKTLDISSSNINDNSVVISIGSHIKSKGRFTVIDFVDDDMTIGKFLDAVGRLYESGFQPKVQELYTKINWPVSRGTPMISPLIKWDHDVLYDVPSLATSKKTEYNYCRDPEKSVIISLTNNELMFYKGHVIDGRNLFPATGYLYLIWEFFTEIISKSLSTSKVCFENVKFHRATTFGKNLTVKLYLTIHASGDFEVSDADSNDTTIVNGRISEILDNELSKQEDDISTEEYETLNPKDVYKELKLRGYNYSGLFKGIKELKGNKALIEWTGNWITFMDNMLQLSITTNDSRSLYVPTGIDRLVINAKEHIKYVESLLPNQKSINLPVVIHKASNIIRSEFIEMRGLFANAISRKKQIGQPILETYQFVPNETNLSLKESIRVNVQIILENKSLLHVKVAELFDDESLHEIPLSPDIQSVLGDMPLIQPEMIIFNNKNIDINMKGITVTDKEFTGLNGNLIFVGSNLFGREQIFEKAMSSLLEGGCLLTLEDQIAKIPKNITILTKHIIGNQQLLLITKQSSPKETVTIKITNKYEDTEQWLPKIQNAIKFSEKVVIYSENEQFSGILGLTNCLKREPGGEKLSCIFIQDAAPFFDLNNRFYKNQINKNLAINVFKNGCWGTYRHLLMSGDSALVQNEHCYGNVTTRGDLSSLKWLEGHLSQMPNEQTVQVYYSAINFRDLMTASGKVPVEAVTTNRLQQQCIQGFEFSGRNTKGVRVMGMITGGAISTMIESSDFTFEVPSEWSLEDAAAIPVVYMTVLYSLIIRARIKRGQSILIHSGTGGVGLAAINTALYFGCNIFVTVGTDAKRKFLNKNYPTIRNSHIGNSRDLSFEQMIYTETNGRGVDIVLNSLAEEKLQASVRCLANGGNFLEIGKFDLSKDNPLCLELIERGCMFHGIMLDRLKLSNKKDCIRVFLQALKDGYVKRLPLTIFKMNQLEEAFRYIGAGKHIGKVLIQIREEEKEKVILPKKQIFEGIPRYFASPAASYIIIGGLGGFGLELADWLITRGAKTIILSSRHGIRSGYQAMRIRTWRSYDIKVVISLDDITTNEGCRSIIRKANEIAPVEGVFNLGVVLKDGLIENQTVADFKISFGPKALATTYLDIVTREACPYLKYFVAFSSVSCGRGNAGQTNYGMSNSIMERICEKRKCDGLPGLAIQWGAIGDVGLVAEMQKEATEIAIGGTLQQRMSSCLEMMDIFLRQDKPVVSSMVVAEKSGMSSADNLVDAVLAIMGVRDLKTISHHSTLSELGMDSMMAVEIKQTLEREFDVFLSAQEMRSLTFSKLLELNDKATQSILNDNAEANSLLQFKNIVEHIYDPDTFELPLIEMPSTNKSKDANIILFPGIEATCIRLKNLSQNIKYRSICLQYTTSEQSKEIETIVETLYKHLKPHVSNTKKEFQFVAHSFGSIIALEIASRFEKDGYLGKIAFIDGSPDLMIEFLKLIKVGTDEFEVMLLSMLLSLNTTPEAMNKLKERLISANNFTERQKIISENIPEDSPYPKEIMTFMGFNIYNLVTSMPKYKPTFNKIKSKVILYKPTIPTIKNIAEDLNLSILCENKIEIKHFPGTHSSIVENVELANDLDRFFSV